MDLTALQKEVNKDIDDSIDNVDITGWLNRALDDLTPYAKYQKSSTIALVKDTKSYTLPTDLNEVAHLLDETNNILYHQIGMNDFSSTGYKRWGTSLLFQPIPTENKNITLYFHARLPHLVNASDIPAIPEHFHDLLVLFAVAKAKYQDEEESMQQNAMQEYLIRKEQFMAFHQSGEVFSIQEVYWQ